MLYFESRDRNMLPFLVKNSTDLPAILESLKLLLDPWLCILRNFLVDLVLMKQVFVTVSEGKILSLGLLSFTGFFRGVMIVFHKFL